MTPKERAAMQQAIEFIVDCEYGKAELALREALAEQAEQEPFDIDDHPPHRLCECRKCMEYFTDKAHEEALAISCHGCDYCNNHLFAGTKCNNCGRKALAEQAEQEPVAEVHNTDTPSNWSIIKPGLPAGTKLYAAPVRTKDNCNHLQDLTDEEIVSVLEYYDHEWDETTFSIAHAAIKKFKEKNK